ncbi:two-component system sensor histidine kinase CreC [Lysobacter oculi]|uniref:histidine kinase n=1 Tax=Solilutibacter oculi TaxID=2698682 RepID=A0A344J3X3_9GAMM|nr:two-component system sensor histidine kinase CreC [Lysobacter oculi]AXA83733.1 two-component system sensor histidine kinase CreC [Lysobacter oculi]
MRVGLRVLLGYFAIVALIGVLLAQVFVQQIKPGVRQAMEDTLIDTANLLAELAADDMKAGRLADGRFAAAVASNQHRDVGAAIYGFDKRRTAYRISVTDARGIVVYDSEGRDIGRDNSRWNDVARTLAGEYGARSSPETPGDTQHSVMHVAAPILDGGRIIGVLTVAKPNRTVAPFIERSQRKVRDAGIGLLVAALVVGIAVAWWISSQLGRLRRYADAVTRGERATPPKAHGEFGELGRALATMREKLEGKQYVEEYVHALTHELKSPLAAIRGSAELLDDDAGTMREDERARFVGIIREQGDRLAQMVDKLLALAAVEHRQRIESPRRLAVADLLGEAAGDAASRAQAANVRLQLRPVDDALMVEGDGFLLRQALGNFIDNAIAFSPVGGEVEIAARRESDRIDIDIRDHGRGVPDYARDRVFERFYSLARPDGGSRSSGLGLSFVAEVAALHGGEAALRNIDAGGALATLSLPAA